MLCPILLQAAIKRSRATKVASSAANGRGLLLSKQAADVLRML
jgi:hypothetical protein